MTTADQDFRSLVAPFERALRLHCYRMLGSSHDSDDVVQETLTRAWRARESLEDRAKVKPWLYRIATNACLDELAKRPKRILASDAPENAWQGGSVDELQQTDEPVWLEPAPSTWLDPASHTELKESVALAFVAALQALTPPQRAVLVLRDVVGFSAEETAESLQMSLSAANSALHRARATVEEKLHGRPLEIERVDEDLLRRYVRAWESADLGALVALLRDDVVATMPPHAMWLEGKARLADFFARRLFARMPAGALRFVRADANGQPAFAVYQLGADGAYDIHAIHVVLPRADSIAEIHHFMTPDVFALFGVPSRLQP